MTCKHMRGDFIQGMWVCADCFHPLDERPKRYGMVLYGRDVGTRQQIVWQAEIATDSEGTSFAKFVNWMVGYLRRRSLWTIPKSEALTQCLEALRDQGEPYGSDGACWEREDATEIVREAICSYWDDAPAGSNA